MADDRFGKKIILLNKEKIHLSANIISDKFLRETVVINIVSLWKCQEVVFRATGATLYGNCHSFAIRLPDILLFVKHMIEHSLFYKQSGWTGMWNNVQKLAFPDLFAESKACFSISIKLARYISSVSRNWNNYNSDKSEDDSITFKVKNNDDDENIGGRPSDDPYELYGIYN